MHLRFGRTAIELVQGDITRQNVDAVVNAANTALAGGGGVDGAIHRAGGPEIKAETARRYPAGCPTGDAVITGAGRLAARYVIHAVGPVYRLERDAECAELLASTYRRCLQIAVAHGCRSLAFPSISTGAYGYPLERAARVALRAAHADLSPYSALETVRWVLFDPAALRAYANAAAELMRTVAGRHCDHPQCRAPLPAEAVYCPRCGRRVEAPAD
jgi:O-acetyl-ADP-ribose deacetylase (regulator of RNase III)